MSIRMVTPFTLGREAVYRGQSIRTSVMDLWIFGYGSLLWNPGFVPVEAVTARLFGWHRSFCMLSIHHRGTEDDPGLVLALDAAPFAVCTGRALRVAKDEEGAVLAALRERELISSAYVEREFPVQLSDGREVSALTYVVDPAHRQYCRFDLPTQAAMIARAKGGRGPNADYLFKTADHLASIGIDDPEIAALAGMVRQMWAR
jgi:glutathione-specific gamma-glutamylcyclotransferase